MPKSEIYYLFINGNWKAFETKTDVIIQIEKKFMSNPIFNKQLFDTGDTYNRQSLIDNFESIANSFLGLIQKLIFKFFINNKREIFVFI